MGLSVITIPVLLQTNTSSAGFLHQWLRVFEYGHAAMPPAAVSVTGLYAFTALRKRSVGSGQWRVYAAAALSTIGIVPFTLLIMMPTNDILFEWQASPEAVALGSVQHVAKKWAFMHFIRSLFPLLGAVVGLLGVSQEGRF